MFIKTLIENHYGTSQAKHKSEFNFHLNNGTNPFVVKKNKKNDISTFIIIG